MNDFNRMAEIEVPAKAVQSRLAQTSWAVKMELDDWSIDPGIVEINTNFARENSRTPLPFNRDSIR